jgi:hypothetical protein
MRILTLALLLACLPALAEQSTVSLDGKAISVTSTPAAAKSKTAVLKIADTFKTDADLVFKGAMVPKGEYSLYVQPAADKWLLIISKPSKAYDSKLEVGRANMTLTKPPAPAATSRVTLTKAAAFAAKLEVASGDTVATAQFRLDRVGSNSEW